MTTTPFITPLSSPLSTLFDAAQADKSAAQGAGQGAAQSFGTMLQSALSDVNKLQTDAAGQAKAFALGQTDDIHSVMIAGQKATVALQMTTQVRNNIISAYQSVMQMTM